MGAAGGKSKITALDCEQCSAKRAESLRIAGMTTARARARAEITAEILASARRQLAEVGPAALSLRAVARDIGMVSSAVYRYVASRDELITALLVECYDELGNALEAADASAREQDLRAGHASRRRWRAVCGTIRDWAKAHPHEYALLYGSPVPGYRAPETTVPAAARVGAVIARVTVAGYGPPSNGVGELTGASVTGGAEAAGGAGGETADGSGAETAGGAGEGAADDAALGLEPGIAGLLTELAGASPGVYDSERSLRGLSAWGTLFGLVSFELFGHYVGTVADPDVFFAAAIERLADDLGMQADA